MKVSIQKKEEPKEITDPKIKEKLIKSMVKSLKKHTNSKKDIKKLIYHYYHHYPQNSKEGIAWALDILPEEDLESYVRHGILVKSKDGNMICLGPNGLHLISMWKTEKFTKWVIFLSIIMLILTIISLIK